MIDRIFFLLQDKLHHLTFRRDGNRLDRHDGDVLHHVRAANLLRHSFRPAGYPHVYHIRLLAQTDAYGETVASGTKLLL